MWRLAMATWRYARTREKSWDGCSGMCARKFRSLLARWNRARPLFSRGPCARLRHGLRIARGPSTRRNVSVVAIPMKISIVTVALNAAETIEDTLRSVASQTHPDVEHVIIDGVSRDATLDIVRRYPHVAKVVSERDHGLYDAMNKGLDLATGDVLGDLNADDVYGDERVLERVAAAFADPELEACWGDMALMSHDLSRLIRYWRSSPYAPGKFARGWVPPHPTFFCRRDVYQRYGEFDLSYTVAADFELLLRLIEKHRIKTTYIPALITRFRMGGVSNRSLRNILRGNREILRALRTNGVRISPLWPITKFGEK